MHGGLRGIHGTHERNTWPPNTATPFTCIGLLAKSHALLGGDELAKRLTAMTAIGQPGFMILICPYKPVV